MPVNRTDIVAYASTFRDVKWRHQGRSERGIDCVGLIVRVGRDLGLGSYDVKGYRRTTHGHTMIEHMKRAGMAEKPLGSRKPGDVIVFNDGAHNSHGALFYCSPDGTERLIHASAKHKKVVDEPFDHEWKRAAVFCFEYPGVRE